MLVSCHRLETQSSEVTAVFVQLLQKLQNKKLKNVRIVKPDWVGLGYFKIVVEY